MTDMNILDLFRTGQVIATPLALLVQTRELDPGPEFVLERFSFTRGRVKDTRSLNNDSPGSDRKTNQNQHDKFYQKARLQEQIFYSGFKEFARLHRANSHAPEAIVEGASRAMRISMNRELETLETHIPFLGTVGSISPYIGLFGTVWGIMHAFIALGAVKQATLQMVAPGIAEALIATAIGLFAAIPAVMAYNRLNQRVNKLELNYDNFMEEFTAILHRQAFTTSESNKG